MKYITDINLRSLQEMSSVDAHGQYSEEEKEYVMAYLRRFDTSMFTSAPVIDIFTGSQVTDADNGYFDGEYTWFQSEIYYFEHYGLKLRKDFLNHVVLASQSPATRD